MTTRTPTARQRAEREAITRDVARLAAIASGLCWLAITPTAEVRRLQHYLVKWIHAQEREEAPDATD